MRRASVLVAVTAVSLLIVSACTSFPDLTVDEAAGDDAASSSSGDDSGSGPDGSAVKQDGSAGSSKDGSVGPDGSSGIRDAAPGADAAQPDSATDPCTASSIDCSVTANKACKPCVDECATGCVYNILLGGAGSCCANEMGSSGKYAGCCYYGNNSCTKSCGN